MPYNFVVYTVEFNAKKTYIPGYRRDWRRVATTHTRVRGNSLRQQPAESTQVQQVCLLKPFFQSIKLLFFLYFFFLF